MPTLDRNSPDPQRWRRNAQRMRTLALGGSVIVSPTGGIKQTGTGVAIKLDGSSLSLSSAGLKLNPASGVAYYAFGTNNFIGTGTFTGSTVSAYQINMPPLTSGATWQVLSDGGNLTFSIASGGSPGVSQLYITDSSQTMGWNGRVQFTSAGTGTGVAFVVKDSGLTPRFTLLDNGTATFANNVTVTGTLATGTGLSADVASNTAATSPQFQFTRSRGTLTSRAAVQNGDTLFNINTLGYYNATQNKVVATLKVKVDGSIVGSSIPTAYVFSIASGSTFSDIAKINTSGYIQLSGYLACGDGSGLKVGEDSGSGAATMGVATLVGGTIQVFTANVFANSRIFLTAQGTGGTPGHLYISAVNDSSDFTISSTSILDTRPVAWLIVTPA